MGSASGRGLTARQGFVDDGGDLGEAVLRTVQLILPELGIAPGEGEGFR